MHRWVILNISDNVERAIMRYWGLSISIAIMKTLNWNVYLWGHFTSQLL